MASKKTPVGFMDLPQEVRDIVYLKIRSTYSIDVATMPSALKQPTVSMVSRRLRRESLDVFYGQEKFMVDLRGWTHEDWPRAWTPQFIFNNWILAIGDHNAARLHTISFLSHNFRLTFNINREVTPRATFRFRVTRHNASEWLAEDAPHDYRLRVAADRVRERIAYVLDEMVGKSGEKHLSSADVISLCDAVVSIQPLLCTRNGIGYLGAILGKDVSVAPNTEAHTRKCEECGYHRILRRDRLRAANYD